MAKCSLDIKLDIIDNVRGKLLTNGLIGTSGQTMEIINAEEAVPAIRNVNESFGENLVEYNPAEPRVAFINPSDELVEKYYQRYLDKMGFRQLNEEEQARGGYTEEDRGEFFQKEGTTVSSAASPNSSSYKSPPNIVVSISVVFS